MGLHARAHVTFCRYVMALGRSAKSSINSSWDKEPIVAVGDASSSDRDLNRHISDKDSLTAQEKVRGYERWLPR